MLHNSCTGWTTGAEAFVIRSNHYVQLRYNLRIWDTPSLLAHGDGAMQASMILTQEPHCFKRLPLLQWFVNGLLHIYTEKKSKKNCLSLVT